METVSLGSNNAHNNTGTEMDELKELTGTELVDELLRVSGILVDAGEGYLNAMGEFTTARGNTPESYTEFYKSMQRDDVTYVYGAENAIFRREDVDLVVEHMEDYVVGIPLKDVDYNVVEKNPCLKCNEAVCLVVPCPLCPYFKDSGETLASWMGLCWAMDIEHAAHASFRDHEAVNAYYTTYGINGDE